MIRVFHEDLGRNVKAAEQERAFTLLEFIAKSFAQGIGNSNINYFVGLDVERTLPQTFLSGDDHLMVGSEARGSVVVGATRVKPGLQRGSGGWKCASIQYFTTAGSARAYWRFDQPTGDAVMEQARQRQFLDAVVSSSFGFSSN